MHPAVPAPTTALATVLRRWRQRLPRTALVLFAVCLGIAVLLQALGSGRFGVKLVYSLCIGASCTLINDLAWFAQAWSHDKLRSLRRLPPSPGPYIGGWAGVLPAAAVCLALGPPMGQFIADWIFGFNSPSLYNLDSKSARFTLVISALATLVLIVVVSTAERLSAARAQAETAQRQAAENQLRLLQSQLEPHMLFNTLANLRVLIGMDPARAQAMLDRLIAFLRATLNASRSPQHSLATEFERVADYLALMDVRMGARLHTQLNLPDALRDLPVPTLLLQPLVENAIKHGLEPKVQGGRIEVSARRDAGLLLLSVRDTGIGLDAAAASSAHAQGSHFGLAQARERLATLFGSRATLSLADAGDSEGGVLVSLRLPIDAAVANTTATNLGDGVTPNPAAHPHHTA